MKRTVLLALLAVSCGGTTGSHLVTFQARGGGPADATGSALTFSTAIGYQVTLTRARLLVGAVYLNQSVPVSGAAASGCVLPGIYVAEAFGPAALDLLSPILQPFPAFGEGTETPARTAEVWLTSGDVNAPVDPTVILDVAGTATKSGTSYPFQGIVTISANRAIASSNPAGANPICKQRIVTPILVDLTPTDGGLLTLRVDPRGMFQTVDFAALGLAPGSTTLLQIPDTQSGAGAALFKGLLSNAGVYQFTWSP